jgi:hypothetical protein
MNRLLSYFNRKTPNTQIMKLANELKNINENKTMDTDLRLKSILENVELAQRIIAVPRERIKA